MYRRKIFGWPSNEAYAEAAEELEHSGKLGSMGGRYWVFSV